MKPTTHLPVAHQRGVLSHQYVGAKEEDEGVAEAQQRPVQERSEGQQGVLADVPEGHTSGCLLFLAQSVHRYLQTRCRFFNCKLLLSKTRHTRKRKEKETKVWRPCSLLDS